MDLPGPGERHLSVGNINLDIVLSVPHPPGLEESLVALDQWIGLGGAAANYAIAMARMGGRCSIVAATGGVSEDLGLLSILRGTGVDVSHVKLVPGEGPGVAVVISIPSISSRIIVKSRGANRHLRPEDLPIGRWAHVHLASVDPMLAARASEMYDSVSYDPGGVAISSPREVLSVAPLVDYVMVNSRELEALAGGSGVDSARRLLGGRVKAVVVKMGVEGAYAVSRMGVVRVTSPRVKVLDTTGAGDAFNAAFNLWISRGASLGDALRAGVAAGAAKVSRIGSSSMPSLEEVLEVMSMIPPV
ncbi:MAG: PfkB family carbohydrate kinase [Desulfurococcales archaeon]|nr:PfkB family carbohydrate kinase [Desulfurococcales archaeon]MCE4604947.1 PfkB family carbohydrate kinase [Desulfurococcales archaeon]